MIRVLIWAEGLTDAQEGKTSVVHLPEDNPETVAAMIAYLYFRDYDRVIQDLTYSALERGKWFSPARLHLNDEVPSTCVAWADLQDLGDSKHEIPFHIAMYRLAHKYGIEGLQAKAERELEIIIDGYGLDWDSDTIVVLVNQLKSVSSLGNGMNLVPQSLARIIVFSTKRHLKCCKVLEAIRDFAELNYQMVLFQWGP